jgi:hypothetical protein
MIFASYRLGLKSDFFEDAFFEDAFDVLLGAKLTCDITTSFGMGLAKHL